MIPPAEIPSTFIKIIDHPHSGISDPTIISLEGTMSIDSRMELTFLSQTVVKPWAPFCTQADFEYTETAVLGLLSKELVNKQLSGIHNSWSSHSTITLRSHADMEQTLQVVRTYGVPVQS